ncbi:MAG: IF-2 protein [Myxococcaceae bacterium]|nr:IF-2 protein [Myxococcaceae bacterium]
MPSPGLLRRLWRAFVRLVVATVVLSLAALAVVLLSQLNARTFSLRVDDGKLVVLKGKLMPTGAEPWRPTDAALADAYAPIDLKGTQVPGLLGGKFDDRDSLDRALFTALEQLARPRVATDDPRALEEGAACLRRARLLKGLTDEQLATLRKLETDVAYYLARTQLEESLARVEEALAQLKLATQTDSRHQREASQMLLTVEPPAKALSSSLRTAVHQLSAPPEQAPAPVASPDAGTP